MSRGVNIESLSDRLRLDEGTGIWVPKNAARHEAPADRGPISYPVDQNDACFRLEGGSFWFNHRNRCITTAVGRFPPQDFILDVGGGNGFVARALVDAGYDTVVLEPGPQGARNAKEGRRLPAVINATVADAAIRPGSVANIGAFDVLEHIEDDRTFIRRLYEIARPGGYLYITVPAFDWLWSISDVEAMHHRRYTSRSIADALAGSFDVLYWTCLFQRLVPLFMVMRVLPYRAGLARPRSAESYEREHAAGSRRLARVFASIVAHEVAAIAAGKSLTVGSSLLVVARRVRE
jgi:SAM-dependent methyltransferase